MASEQLFLRPSGKEGGGSIESENAELLNWAPSTERERRREGEDERSGGGEGKEGMMRGREGEEVRKRRRGGFSVLEEEEEGEEMVEIDAKEKKREQAKLRARKASKKSQWGGAAKKKQKTAVKKKKEEDDNEGEENTIKRDRIVDWEHVLGKTSSVVLPLTSEMDARLDEPAVEEEEEEDAFYERVWRKMSKIDRYKCAVFKDLHEKGFTMTSAAKFGGDYLAYPGDPMLFHAYFTVRVLERGEKMTPLSCSSVTRMAHAARKNVVFAFCGEEGDEGGGSDDSVLRIRYFTCVPDIELSSNRGF